MPLHVMLGVTLAAGPGPSVEWRAPVGCPNQAQVLEQARAFLGRPALEDAMQAVTIRGAIEPAPTGFVLDVDIRTPSGSTRKTARADDCTVLASVAALMVAVAVDPVQATHALQLGSGPASAGAAALDGEQPVDRVPRPSQGNPEPGEVVVPELPPGPTSPELAALDAAPEAADPPRPRAPLRGLARASGSVGRGLVPNLDGGLAFGIGLLSGPVRAELLAFHVLAQDARYPAPSTAGATVSAWGAAVRTGPRVELGPIELHVLGGIGIAALVATGTGVRVSRTSTDAWIGLSLVPGLRWVPSPRLALGVDLEAEVALRRPAFTVGTAPAVYRTPSLGARGSLVVELRFGDAG